MRAIVRAMTPLTSLGLGLLVMPIGRRRGLELALPPPSACLSAAVTKRIRGSRRMT
jgi:hypothetical protein